MRQLDVIFQAISIRKSFSCNEGLPGTAGAGVMGLELPLMPVITKLRLAGSCTLMYIWRKNCHPPWKKQPQLKEKSSTKQSQLQDN